jgi:HAD superfamily hydrolase (TIGR01459 family)
MKLTEQMILPFSALIDQFDAFLLDAYGVFWASSEVGMLPEAKETMALLMAQGKKVGILSNSTQLNFQDKLAKWGVHENIHYHFLLTSGQVLRQLLLADQLPFPTPRKSYWLFGSDHPRYTPHSIAFKGTAYRQTMNIDEADFIHINIPQIEGYDQEDPKAFLPHVREAALKNIPVLCSNPDPFAHEGAPPRLVVRQGTIAQLFQEQGASVHFIGKPFPLVYQEALRRFPDTIPSHRILMIGDTPETDIRGARQAGLATAVVTETGVMAGRLKRDGLQAIHQLPESDKPTFAIERFVL